MLQAWENENIFPLTIDRKKHLIQLQFYLLDLPSLLEWQFKMHWKILSFNHALMRWPSSDDHSFILISAYDVCVMDSIWAHRFTVIRFLHTSFAKITNGRVIWASKYSSRCLNKLLMEHVVQLLRLCKHTFFRKSTVTDPLFPFGNKYFTGVRIDNT